MASDEHKYWGIDKIDNLPYFASAYFLAESEATARGFLTAVIAIALSAYFILAVKIPFLKGLGYALLLAAFLIGPPSAYVFWRTDRQVTALSEQYQHDQKSFFSLPLYPMIDDRNITQSSKWITDPKVWNTKFNGQGWAAYLGAEHQGEVSPFAAAARATDLSGLPPTYTCVGDLDPFCDGTIEFVARLRKAGVPTEFHLYPGCFHGFENIVPNAPISIQTKKEYNQALKLALQE